METKRRIFRYVRHLAIAVMMAFTLCLLTSGGADKEKMDGPLLCYNGEWVKVDKDLEQNTYTAEEFITVDGRMTCTASPYRIGVDVSAHQGKINWKKAAKDGISFAMLRCGVRGYGSAGNLVADDTFAYNVKKAAAAGLDVGAYFFSQAVTVEEAEEEARFVLDILGDTTLTLPVVYDWETIDAEMSGENGARTDGMDSVTVTQCALAFCRMIEDAGYEPMVYFNNEIGYACYDNGLIQETDLPVWFAAYTVGYPNYFYHIDWWQYTDKGTVEGIEGNVDMNIMLLERDIADGESAVEGSAS